MKRIPSIATVMTPFPYSVDVSEPASAAEKEMQKHEIHHLPVTDGGTLVGVVSEWELRSVLHPNRRGDEPRDLPVRDLCVREAFIVELHEPLDQVLMEMADGRYDSALVVKNGKLAGIFTVSDACREFCELLREEVRSSGGGDAA